MAVVSAHLPQIRAVYNFNAKTFVRAIGQLRDTDRDAAAYAIPVRVSQRHAFLQLLLAHEASPQTVVFVGYGDDRSGFTDVDHSVTPLALTRRTFFVKLSYAWRP
jgi:hypothetical protein